MERINARTSPEAEAGMQICPSVQNASQASHGGSSWRGLFLFLFLSNNGNSRSPKSAGIPGLPSQLP